MIQKEIICQPRILYTVGYKGKNILRQKGRAFTGSGQRKGRSFKVCLPLRWGRSKSCLSVGENRKPTQGYDLALLKTDMSAACPMTGLQGLAEPLPQL